MSQKPVPIPEPEEDETQSNISETPSLMPSSDLPYPVEHFDAVYLSAQTLEMLKTMKKTCKIRAKTAETIEDYTRVISEWYIKKMDKPKRSRKAAKASSTAVINTALNLDISGLADVTTSPDSNATKTVKTKVKPYTFEPNELEQYKKHIISTRESMYDKVHQIHNFLRNKGAGYGMYALKVFNLFWGLRKIEDMNMIEKLGLSDIPKFSDLLKLANVPEHDRNEKHDRLKSLITRDILDRLAQPDTRNLLFYEIPQHIMPGVYAGIVMLIDDLARAEVSNNFQLSGKIYEYFVGRDATAISELGAYFTDRHITSWIYKNLCSARPTPEGKIPIMIDPFGGSGGFTTGFIMFMIQCAKELGITIPWETELHKVFHYDINHDVLNSAALEFMCLTETKPNAGDYGNIKYNNAFESDFAYTGTMRDDVMKFKYIITNPPYGGDTIKTSENKDRNAKISDYINKKLNEGNLTAEEVAQYHKQLSALKQLDNLEREELEKHKVKFETCSRKLQQYIQNTLGFSERDAIAKFNDKEACSLALLMMLVDDDGEVIGVLKEGVFFDSSYGDLRRKLVTMFNVSDVISVPANQFENTTTKTSILKFRNTADKTSIVRFGELIVERYAEDKFIMQNGIVCLDELKGSISAVNCKTISVATRDQILAHPICSLNGKEYANREIIPGDGYKMVALGDLCEITKPKINHPASSGSDKGKYNFYTSSQTPKRSDLCDYTELSVILGTGGTGSCHLDKMFSCSGHNYVLVNHKLSCQYIYNIYKCMFAFIYKHYFHGSTIKNIKKDDLQKIKIPIPESQAVLDSWVARLSEAYDTRLAKEQRAKELEEQVMNRIKEITETEDCDEVKLGDVCNIKTGKNKTPDDKQGTLYPYYGTSGITGYTDYYLFDGINILVARNGTIGNIFLNYGKVYPSDHIFVFDKLQISYMYTYYYMKLIAHILDNMANGTTIKGIAGDKLKSVIIKLPKNKQLITDLEPTFQEIETLKTDAQSAGKRYEALLNELKAEAIKTMPVDYMEDVVDFEQNEPESE